MSSYCGKNELKVVKFAFPMYSIAKLAQTVFKHYFQAPDVRQLWQKGNKEAEITQFPKTKK